MAAGSPDEGGPNSAKPNGGTNSPFRGALIPAERTAEIGRCLQAQHPVLLKEPLPDALAALILRLQEREGGAT
ncbi:hypothetical protein MicloDRAFT_00003830 [Microvirga lotononidis]|uniref:Anti-sigma factor NepR domain-containing protein n=1 Tax=Microvirga lotononidis TaxID=864069 RepID=I4Z3R4_9HYPH|nr:hypothetical protein MicloDRAFT_00003830 [Microvirga lotononidis]